MPYTINTLASASHNRQCVPNVVSANPPMWNLCVASACRAHGLPSFTSCPIHPTVTRDIKTVAMVFGKRSKSWASLSTAYSANGSNSANVSGSL